MGKKDKKKDADKQEAKKKRQAEKATKVAKKRAQKEAKDLGEESIEAIIAEFQEREARKTAVTVTACEQPSPRAHFTMTALPNGELLLFGGEYFDGEETTVYNELFRWNVEKNEWRRIDSLNTPPPRCSHQAVLFKDYLYIFGGEYATLDQFHHYKDLWRLDLRTNAWEEVVTTGTPPSARSGHRMLVWRNYLVVFGGFYEAFRDTHWYNDIHLFSLQEQRWNRVEYAALAQVPRARSGCQMALHAGSDSIYVYGGYSKVKAAGQKAEGKVHEDMWMLNLKPVLQNNKPVWQKVSKKGTKPSARSGAVMTYYKNKAILFGGVMDEEGPHHAIKSMFYNDLYAFDMDRKRWYKLGLKLAAEKGVKKRRRQRRDDTAAGDGDGGDDDEEEYDDDADDEEEDDEEDKNDEDERDLFGYIDENGQVVYVDPDVEDMEHHDDDDGNVEAPSLTEAIATATVDISAISLVDTAQEEQEKKEATAETSEQQAQSEDGTSARGTLADMQDQHKEQEEEKKEGEALSLNEPRAYFQSLIAPSARINPCLMVKGHTLYIYGGVVELGDIEVTLDDCWALDLNKRDSWRKVLPGTMDTMVWRGETDTEATDEEGSRFDDDDEDEDEDDEEDDDDDERDDDRDEHRHRRGEHNSNSREATDAAATVGAQEDEDHKQAKKSSQKKKKRPMGIREELAQLQSELGVDQPERTPLAHESLRAFYARTQATWSNEALIQLQQEGPIDEKVLRRQGFLLAEQRYQELLPVLERLNELQEAQQKQEQEKKPSHRKGRKN